VALDCGYGHGFSVREVIAMVKRVSLRRPGDPAQIVAASDPVRTMLEWKPRYELPSESVSNDGGEIIRL
jgi:UDP-glucose 4-epimerase